MPLFQVLSLADMHTHTHTHTHTRTHTRTHRPPNPPFVCPLQVLSLASRDSLVLLDEVGSGTDPVEVRRR